MMSIAGKLSWIELKLLAREPIALVFVFAYPVVVLVVLSGVFPKGDTVFGGADPADYYLASYVGVVIAAIGLISLPVHLAAYREHGVLRRFRACGVPTAATFTAHIVANLAAAVTGALVLIAVSRLAYDTHLPYSIGGVIAAFLVATLAFLALGFLIASLVPNTRAAQAVGMILFFPMTILCGAGPPPAVMGTAMRHVSDAIPLTYAVDALQQPWLGTGSNGRSLLILAAILLVAGTASARRFRTV
jgi:ABC-2 type transport system permease protein